MENNTNIYCVIVTYNGIKWIDWCLNSIRRSIVHLHTIVVDNHSSDDTITYISTHFPEVIVLAQDHNLGFGKANNLGIDYALLQKATHILLLNQDAAIEPDMIQRLLAYDDGNSILSPTHYDATGSKLDRGFQSYCPVIDDEFAYVNYVNAACWLIPRTIIETIGGFNPLFFHYGEDNNYANRLVFHHKHIKVVRDTKMFHDREVHGNAKAYSNKLMYRKLLMLYTNINISEELWRKQEWNMCLHESFYALRTGSFFAFWRSWIEGSREIKAQREAIKRSRETEMREGLLWLDSDPGSTDDSLILYTIIIPHYQSLDVLPRAVNSIPERKDVEILIIDNSAVPISSTLFPGRKDIRILYSEYGKGAGAARNVGLKHAHGRWLLFMDADDYFLPGAFSAFDLYADRKEDIVFYKTSSVYSDTRELSDRHLDINRLIDCYNSTGDESILRYDWGTPWSKLIRRSLIEQYNITFEESRAANDIVFSLRTGYFARQITTCDSVVYCITTRNGSLTQTPSLQNLTDRVTQNCLYNQFISSHYIKGHHSKSIMYYIYQIYTLHGWRAAIKTLLQSIRMGNNPFIGMNRWITTAKKLKK